MSTVEIREDNYLDLEQFAGKLIAFSANVNWQTNSEKKKKGCLPFVQFHFNKPIIVSDPSIIYARVSKKVIKFENIGYAYNLDIVCRKDTRFFEECPINGRVLNDPYNYWSLTLNVRQVTIEECTKIIEILSR